MGSGGPTLVEPDELASAGPPCDVLVSALRITDERHVIDLNSEEVEPRFLRLPSQNRNRVAVAGPHLWVLNGDRPTPKLHFPLRAVTGRDDAVDEDSIVAEKVGCFARPPHHREVEVTFEYQGFDRAQSRSSITPDGRNKENPGGDEPLVRHVREPSGIALEIVPSHVAPSTRVSPETDFDAATPSFIGKRSGAPRRGAVEQPSTGWSPSWWVARGLTSPWATFNEPV
jgi:hypothetical protein